MEITRIFNTYNQNSWSNYYFIGLNQVGMTGAAPTFIVSPKHVPIADWLHPVIRKHFSYVALPTELPLHFVPP